MGTGLRYKDIASDLITLGVLGQAGRRPSQLGLHLTHESVELHCNGKIALQ